MNKFAIHFYLILFTVSCQSVQTEEQNKLDIEMPVKVEIDNNQTVNPNKEKTTSKIKSSEIISWQQFFKPPPSQSQRKSIEEKLLAWSDKRSIKELLKIARNEVALGRLTNAEAHLRSILRKDPNNLDALIETTMLFLRKKNISKTYEFLSQLKEAINLQENPEQSFVFRYRYILALTHLAHQKHGEAHRILSDLISIDKTFTPAYIALASSYLALGKLDVAEFIAKRGIDRGKEDPGLYNILGVIEEKSHKLDKAEQWYNKAYSLLDTFAPALINRASINIKRFDYKAAEADLKKALIYQPNNVNGLMVMGILKKRLALYKESQYFFQKALELQPENSMVRFNLAILMAERLNSPHKAIRLFHEVIQTAGENQELKQISHSYINDLKNDPNFYYKL